MRLTGVSNNNPRLQPNAHLPVSCPHLSKPSPYTIATSYKCLIAYPPREPSMTELYFAENHHAASVCNSFACSFGDLSTVLQAQGTTGPGSQRSAAAIVHN